MPAFENAISLRHPSPPQMREALERQVDALRAHVAAIRGADKDYFARFF